MAKNRMAKKRVPKTPKVDINLIVFTNDWQEQGNDELLRMFYMGAFENTIGLARMQNKETRTEHSVLVGIDKEGGFYPLAKVLDPSDATLYRAPDGKGDWTD
jgi:hypothetical protein